MPLNPAVLFFCGPVRADAKANAFTIIKGITFTVIHVYCAIRDPHDYSVHHEGAALASYFDAAFGVKLSRMWFPPSMPLEFHQAVIILVINNSHLPLR